MGAMIVRLIAALFVVAMAAVAPARAQTPGLRAEVVVELYTSQGCSQCPRANRLLGAFAREDGVLALTFPVGIWDYLGWHDTFAQPEFSERQRAYSSSLRVRRRFTPQLVIDGQAQTSASDWDAARAAVDAARSDASRRAPDLAVARLRNGRVRVTLGPGGPDSEADVWLLAYEPGPLTVAITRGINANRTIAHYNLVRTIDRLGTWSGAALWYERARCTPECAVIVQVPNGGPVLAAAYTDRRH